VKTNFIDNWKQLKDGEPEAGFTPEEKTYLAKSIGDLQTALETKSRETVEAKLKEHGETINKSIEKFNDWMVKKDETDGLNQKALDEVLTKVKEIQTKGNNRSNTEVKTLQQAMHEALEDKDNLAGIASVGRGRRFKMMLKGPIDLSAGPVNMYNLDAKHKMEEDFEVKDAGIMSGANSLSGQGYITLSGNQVLKPAQKVNARDLVPTVFSPTGTYVYFREETGEGSISRQTTHGADKTLIDFNFARVETVQEYIAGITQFAKQLMRQLPFLQQTLPRLLQREFFKVENRRFWDIFATANAAGGTAVNSSETIDILEIMDAVTALWDADYEASFGILRYTALNRVNKWLIQNGAYANAGGVLSSRDGALMVNGTPVLPVTWIPSHDKFATFDRNYVERIETESLAIEFFEQDDKNVQKNLITARIECMEDFNVLQPAATVIEDLGNSASS
jgi:hypothetical protein